MTAAATPVGPSGPGDRADPVEDLLALTADLVAVPSESHHEAALADVVEARLRTAPWLSVERIGDEVVARTELGRAARLVLAGHTDTVPGAGTPPRLDGDVCWGTGAADMKSGLAVMLALATTMPDPAVDVTYAFYTAEEVAAEHNGLRRLFAERPDLLAGDAAVLGEPTDATVEAGCQGTMRLRLTMAGERAHTARPWMGRNAVHRMGPVLASLAAYEGRRPVLEGCEYREALQAVAVEGGVAGNVVPDRAVLTINHRFAPDRSAAEAEAHVRTVVEGALGGLGPGDAFEVVDVAVAAAPSIDHPLLGALVRRNRLPVRAKLGWTDVARFAEHGIPAVNFGPGDAELAHTAGERVARGPIEAVHRALRDLVVRGAEPAAG